MRLLLISFLVIVLSCSPPPQQQNPAVATTTRISAQTYKESHAKKKNAVLVDVRTPAEFEEGHLKEAQNADFLSGELHSRMQNWDKSKTYYLYCATGNRSGKAAKLMEEAGFKKVYNIGGFKELKEAGLPVIEPPQKQ
ncbi:rhodanese-like domain-containing protein [Pontibacter beigongshangensis]|uniref:rhodanese-like domain-containing protein n=1 Tax=Pontibacter beigongshangensis TaxID=2574733 RepID=UPI00164FE656|nr:rhodanese-like domain-containing protein [Pontibacter beigongshangensis]